MRAKWYLYGTTVIILAFELYHSYRSVLLRAGTGHWVWKT